jgi:carbonic anhydrase
MAHAGPGVDGKEMWRRLLEGNARFVQGLSRGRDLPALRITLAGGQQPGAAVLCCADSRVPPEIIFDQSLGDLFVVRTAGPALGPASLGSLEYAIDHLGVRLLVILGHESCGAVTATVEHPEVTSGHLGAIIGQIAPAADQARKTGKLGPELIEAATNLHLSLLAETLRRESAVIGAAFSQGRLDLVVSKYLLQSGQVLTLNATF